MAAIVLTNGAREPLSQAARSAGPVPVACNKVASTAVAVDIGLFTEGSGRNSLASLVGADHDHPHTCTLVCTIVAEVRAISARTFTVSTSVTLRVQGGYYAKGATLKRNSEYALRIETLVVGS